MELTQGKKIYFASDSHLGAPNFEESLIREKKFVLWLDAIKKDADAIFSSKNFLSLDFPEGSPIIPVAPHH